MGAGASIDDEGDLKKVYEKEKAEGKYTEEQAKTLEEAYNAIKGDEKLAKKGEFYLIGKLRKKYGELNIGDGGGGAGGDAAAAAAPAAAPAAAAEPEPAKPFPKLAEGAKIEAAGPNATESVPMTELPKAIEKAIAAKLTPLIIDRSADSAVDTFFSYSSTVLDAKKMALDVSVRKRDIAEVIEEQRKLLAMCLRQGRQLVVACGGAAPDFVGQFSDAACGVDLSGKAHPGAKAEGKSVLPLELFHEAGKPLTQEGWADKLYREDEVKSSGGLAMADEKFSVVVTTTFEHDDIGDFHFKEEAHGLPRGKFQPIWVAHNDGTVPKE